MLHVRACACMSRVCVHTIAIFGIARWPNLRFITCLYIQGEFKIIFRNVNVSYIDIEMWTFGKMIAHFLYIKINSENKLSENYCGGEATNSFVHNYEVYLASYLHFLIFPCSLYLTISINAIPRFCFHIQSFISSTLLFSRRYCNLSHIANAHVHYKESKNVRYTQTRTSTPLRR